MRPRCSNCLPTIRDRPSKANAGRTIISISLLLTALPAQAQALNIDIDLTQAKRLLAISCSGQDYDPEWGKRLTGEGTYAELIAQRYKVTASRLGLAKALPGLRSDLFRVPPKPGDQLSLF